MKTDTNKQISIRGLEGTVPIGRSIQLQVVINNALGYVDNLVILFNKYGQKIGEDLKQKLYYDSESSTEEYSCFKAEVTLHTTGYRTYIFSLNLDGEQCYIKNNGEKDAILTSEEYPFFEVFVYEENFSTPTWAKGGIMYQIYIDTFNASNIPECVADKISPWGSEVKWLPDADGEYRNNRFFGGNLQGIIEKLPYLKSLGVTIIYLTPIFKSESSNRYDIVDYEKIDEMVGDWQIMEELYNKAHNLGMHIILDCVFNHCNPANELFVTKNHLFTGNFWWGYKHLAEFNMGSEEYKELLKKLLNFYLQYSDGIRLDVADNLSDEILRFIRVEIKKIENKLNKEIYLLGEVWKNAIKGDHRAFLEGNELDSVMNYQFADAIYRYVRWGNFYEFKKKVFANVINLYPKCVCDVLMNPLSTHDIPRIPNILSNPLMVRETYLDNAGDTFIWDYDKLPIWIKNGEYQTEQKRRWEKEKFIISEEENVDIIKLQKLAILMQYTLPGIPSIFAGDELGASGLKDPFNRICMPWEKEENNELKDFYIRLGQFRLKYREIFAEGFCTLIFLDEKVCIYKREWNNKILYCVFNRTKEIVNLQEKFGKEIVFSLNESTQETLNPYEALIIEK